MRDRFIDSGAVFAGWVGLGMALVLAIAFELIIPVQAVVFLLALPMGILIGVYANVRAERWRPRARVVANAVYAGIVTGVGIAILYVAIRLVFVYGDGGSLPDGTALNCQIGPDCVYARHVAAGNADELAGHGITDGASLEAAAWRELISTGLGLIVLTATGSVIGGVARSLSEPKDREVPLRIKPGTRELAEDRPG